MSAHLSPRRSRMGATAAAVLFGTTGILVAPAPAHAAAASVRVVNGALTFQAGTGEANRIRVTASPSRVVTVLDAVPLTAGAGCEATANPNAVTCEYPTSVRISTGDRDDTVSLLMGHPSVVDAGAGNDRVAVGGSPAETEPSHTIFGGPGDDILTGGHGSDLIDGGPGSDVMSGGNNGHDLVDYSRRTRGVQADLGGTAENDGEAGEGDTIGAGIDGIRGGSGNDLLTGNDAANELVGNGGDDHLAGYSGDDQLTGGTGDDLLHGGGDDNTITDSSGSNEIFAGGGNDVINLSGWNLGGGSDVYAGPGNDVIRNGWSKDWIDGGPGVDEIIYGSIAGGVRVNLSHPRHENGMQGENDSLQNLENVTVGNAGIVDGRNGTNTITGSEGPNRIRASWADDEIYGRGGDDVIYPGYGEDTVHGNDGNDRIVDTDERSDGAPRELFADKLYGDYGNDYIDAKSGNDHLYGYDGEDTLVGGAGWDRIHGERGDDELSAGEYRVTDSAVADHDHLDCGPNRDTYYRSGRQATFDDCEVSGG